MLEYSPITAVWEITKGCNMNCMHCGSVCDTPHPDELSLQEAFELCDDLKELGVRWVTLSGGEPLLRPGWHRIAARLSRNGIVPNLITNGWLMTRDMAQLAKQSGVGTVAISFDGLRKTHDKIRKAGSFSRCANAFRILKQNEQYCGAITTITKMNIDQLEEMRTFLVGMGVDSWQLQIGIPMGNMVHHKDQLIEPEQVERILDFCLDTARRKQIMVYPADCLGYFTRKEELIRYLSLGAPRAAAWNGCNAGKRSFGILHNGDIVGCTSIRDPEYIEGNVRERSLAELWRDPNSFAWSRKMRRSDLGGACSECVYADKCLGGCPNTRLTMKGRMNAENPYCSYRVSMEKTTDQLRNNDDIEGLMLWALHYAREGNAQLSSLTVNRVLECNPEHVDALSLGGHVNFSIGNYQLSLEQNLAVLEKEPLNCQAHRGVGLSLCRMGKLEEGIVCLKMAVELATPGDEDALNDLILIYRENGMTEKEDALRRRCAVA